MRGNGGRGREEREGTERREKTNGVKRGKTGEHEVAKRKRKRKKASVRQFAIHRFTKKYTISISSSDKVRAKIQ